MAHCLSPIPAFWLWHQSEPGVPPAGCLPIRGSESWLRAAGELGLRWHELPSSISALTETLSFGHGGTAKEHVHDRRRRKRRWKRDVVKEKKKISRWDKKEKGLVKVRILQFEIALEYCTCMHGDHVLNRESCICVYWGEGLSRHTFLFYFHICLSPDFQPNC